MEAFDCETLRATWPAQPANAWSAVAFLVAGAVVGAGHRTSPARWLGAALAATGAGSILFHGDPGSVTQWAHDASLVFLVVVLALVAGNAAALHPAVGAAGLVAASFVAAIAPWATTTIVLTGIGVALVREAPHLAHRPPSSITTAAVLLAAGAAATLLGRTGGPLCSPEALVQFHAAWHVLAAAGIVAYAHARGWVAVADRSMQ